MTNYDEQLVQRLREQYMDTKQMLPNVLCHDSADAITKLRAERDALRADLAAAQAEISARSDLMQGYLDCWRNDKARAERAENDLAAARALLLECRPHLLCGWMDPCDLAATLPARIDAALAEGKP